ncbi:MAG: eukaryotic-like serine/threonine-protein kinase [Acidobacteriota bacterium]|jgi:serine/threonine-protein kinase|nr:eukaryotic-like serine/threonine-protein kinase [Acidobacteriota bacterium]
MLGRVVGSYRIVEKIGEGGMGAVYRAVDEMLEREVAVKAIRPDLTSEPQIVERFRAEAKSLARVSHPAIATIYSFFLDAGELFLAMEFVRGRTLAQVLATEGAMPWPRAVMLLCTALEGIEQAHRAGIIHRDLKPDNLMLTPAGTLKVMDFGIARMMDSSHLTQTGLLVGTLRYIAPEQIRGEEVDRRTDVYALGAVLYQMITGRVPFDGKSDFAILKAQLEDPPPPPISLTPSIPAWLDRAILRALEKDPAARFQTVEEMRTVLVRQGHQEMTTPEPLSRPADDELPTMVLPPRATLAGVTVGRTGVSAPPSLNTTATDRPLLSMPPPPPLPPAAAVGTSYRPVDRAGWKRGALAAVAGVAILLLGFLAWRLFQPEKPASGDLATTPVPASTPAPISTATAAPPIVEPTPAAQSPAPRREPSVVSPPRPIPARTPIPEPAPPPVSTPQEAHPAEPRPAPEETAPEPAPAVPLTGELPYEELRRVSDELVADSEKLGDTYGELLEKKEDGGAELTETDNQLKDELEALTDAATRLNKRFKEGFFSRLTRSRLSSPENRVEIAKRLQILADTARRVDHLMGQVQPGPEVRQGWQEVRRRWVRVGELMRGR